MEMVDLQSVDVRRPARSNHACLYPVVTEFGRKAAAPAIFHEVFYLDWLLSDQAVFRLAEKNRQMTVGSSRRH